MTHIADTIIRNGTVTNNGPRKRQAAFRARMKAEGLVQVTGWVHEHQASDAIQVLRRLKKNEDLTPGPLRNTVTNKFVSLNRDDDGDEE